VQKQENYAAGRLIQKIKPDNRGGKVPSYWGVKIAILTLAEFGVGYAHFANKWQFACDPD
jgi:hypothetical protein